MYAGVWILADVVTNAVTPLHWFTRSHSEFDQVVQNHQALTYGLGQHLVVRNLPVEFLLERSNTFTKGILTFEIKKFT